jgi:hypothetical protein
VIGVRAALFIFALGMIASPLVGVFTALRGVREQSADVDEEEPPAPAAEPVLGPAAREDVG